MKQNLIEWYTRNGFKFWKIENSKGKIIAENTAKSKDDKSNADDNASRLSIELDSLERNPTADRYTVNAMQIFGHDWKVFPFQTYGSNAGTSNFGTGGGSAMDMAIMFGKMQSDLANQSLIYQMQRDKEREERERNEANTGISEMIKPLIPMLVSSVAPMAIKGMFDLAGKSPQILAFLEKLTANPNVQAGMTQMVESYFMKNNVQSTETTNPID